jgi:hypothetical protein
MAPLLPQLKHAGNVQLLPKPVLGGSWAAAHSQPVCEAM